MKPATSSETIIALATPNGVGAIGVIRLSGPMAISITNEVFASKALKSKQLLQQAANTIHFGVIHDKGLIIDEVLVSLFIGPHSYTGENTTEISCHGSVFIQQQIIQLFTRRGVRMAQPGEFTLRAFLNGKMDLSQAEAVADLIASNSAASHQLAMQQMRGGFSQEIKALREQLIHFASLIELELDFAEEDVEFANRTDLKQLVMQLHKVIQRLLTSFETGNVLKNGVPVAIVGRPNAGKSTLLNALLNEERAIVSHIAGTTRDVIEDEVTLGGIRFRFIDTAGIRDTTDTIEAIGVVRAYEKINQAQLIIYLFDVNATSIAELQEELRNIKIQMNPSSKQHLIVVGNKIDEGTESAIKEHFVTFPDMLYIAAKNKEGVPMLVEHLLAMVNSGALNENEVIVSNARHAEALFHTNEALQRVYTGLEANITGDLLAIDIRRSLYYLGEITGEISSDDLLVNIFSKFCIGK